MKFPRRKLLLLLAMLPLATPAIAKEAAVQSTFTVDRTVYMVPMKDPADPSRTIKRFASEFSAERAWQYHASTSDTPANATRRSEVTYTLRDDGTLLFREIENGAEIRQLDLPLGENPMAALTPLMALHPHTQIAPELLSLRTIGLMITEDIHPADGDHTLRSAEWEWRVSNDSESDRPARIEQYSRQTGFLVRTTDFSHWTRQPSGRELPSLVVTRTYFEGQHPAVELVFSNITEHQPLPYIPPAAIQPGQVPNYGPEGLLGPVKEE